MFFGLLILLCVLLADATLEPNFPVNAQLPPVARVSQLFRFQFAPSTFSGAGSGATYSLLNAPPWLNVDSDNRTLIGTPGPNNAGENKFTLIAQDAESSADMQVRLVVAAEEGPKLGKPVLPQLERIGPTSAPSTIFVYPGHPFLISFSADTFTNTRLSTVYYGTTQENAPLPSWVTFDPSELKFAGYAPSSPSSGGQSFIFHLIASDVAGFSAATASFQMVVSPHILAFNHSEQTLHIAHGRRFTSPEFINYLTLDGKEPDRDNLTSVDIKSPGWMSVNKNLISFSGTPPEGATDEDVTITVSDTYQDTATLRVSLKFTRLFDGVAMGCNATIGEPFVFVFNQSALASSLVDLEVNSGKQLSSWLHYNPDTKTLRGNVPTRIHPQEYTISLTAIQGSIRATRNFTINIIRRTTAPKSSRGIEGNRPGVIAISVVIPCAFLCTILLLFCCWRRRRQPTVHEGSQLPLEKGLERHQYVSASQPHQPAEKGIGDGELEVPRENSLLVQAPKLELRSLWTVDSLEERESAEDGKNKENIPSSAIGWAVAAPKDPEALEKRGEVTSVLDGGNTQGSPPRRRLSDRSKIREPLKPIQPKRSMKRSSVTSSRSRRYSKRSSGISTVGTGLPMRMSGAGHGAGGLGPLGYAVSRLSWQSPHVHIHDDESSFENLAPLFPRPPAPSRPRSFNKSERSKRTSMRVAESRQTNSSEGDPFEEFVQNRARSRNSSNPMFSSQGSRRLSSGIGALERARSTRNRSVMTSSVAYSDESRKPMDKRPISTAISASIYPDDHRLSGQGEGVLESLSPSPTVPRLKRYSSIAQRYRDIAAPPPRFFSELSLANAQRGGLGNDPGQLETYNDLPYGRSETGRQVSPSWVSGYSLSSVVGLYQGNLAGRSPSPPQTAFLG